VPFTGSATGTPIWMYMKPRAPTDLDGPFGTALAAGETAATGKAAGTNSDYPQPGLLAFSGKGQRPLGAGTNAEVAEAATLGAEVEHRTGDISRACDNSFRTGVQAAAALSALRFPSDDETWRAEYTSMFRSLPKLPGWHEHPADGEYPLR
jgi:hypothetical protein